MKFGALVLITTLVLRAQTPLYEVRGTVTELGAGGIADAEVTVSRIEDGTSKTVKTDGQGIFRVPVDQPGIYVAGAAKATYVVAGLPGQTIAIDAGRPRVDVPITLMRVGEVTGRVIDENSRDPVPGAEVTLFTKQWNYGQLTMIAASREPAVTDAEGRFRFSGMRPGEYFASARPRPASIQVLKDFSAADRTTVDEILPATYWPGGGDVVSAYGAQLGSGGYADVGTMFVRKAPQYRVHVTLSNCVKESIQVSVLKRDGGSTAPLGVFPCGPLLLRGLDPGSYALYVAPDRRNGADRTDSAAFGSATIVVVDKNLDAVLPLQRGIVIEGHITLADGVTAPAVVPRITTRPADLITGARSENDSTILWSPDQRNFRMTVSPRPQALTVVGFSGGPYIKEIRYNGTPVRGSILPINTGVPSHKLEIVMDDKYGSLAGSVTDSSRTVADAQVIIVNESARLEDLGAQSPGYALTSASGTFPATRLAPGDYRAVAFPRALQTKIHEAGVLERLLSTAQKFTVAPGGTQTVTIRLSDLR